MNFQESAEQSTISGWLKKQHPEIIFHTTRLEGKRELWEQNQVKKQNSDTGFPDTFILHPMHGYAGLMIENKRYGTKLFKKDGQFTNEHYRNQYITHQKLLQAGYAVYFAVGVSEAIEIITRYLSGNLMSFMKVDLKPLKEDTAADIFFAKFDL